jgi:hypothetical protein
VENGDSAFALPRLELEMALELGETDQRCWTDLVRGATKAAGGELLFVLPDPNPGSQNRQRAMIRLREDENVRLVFVCQNDDGHTILDEHQIEPELAEFANATVNVMRHLQADDRVIGPLADSIH